MKALLRRILTWHPLLTLVIMLASAMSFGLLSFDLFHFLKNNIELVSDYGVQALEVGALEEFVHLFIYGLLSLLSYIIFKTCEKILVEWTLK